MTGETCPTCDQLCKILGVLEAERDELIAEVRGLRGKKAECEARIAELEAQVRQLQRRWGDD